MQPSWQTITQRIVPGVGVQPCELLQVRERTGQYDVLREILRAIEGTGATPLTEFSKPAYLHPLLRDAPPIYLARWDQHRLGWIEQINSFLSKFVVILGTIQNDDCQPICSL